MDYRSFSIRIPAELASQIEEIAAEEGRSMNNVIFDALTEGVEYYKATREAWRIAKEVIKQRIASASGTPITIEEIQKAITMGSTLNDDKSVINQKNYSG